MLRPWCPKDGERRDATGGERTFKVFWSVDLEGEGREANSNGLLPDACGAVAK